MPCGATPAGGLAAAAAPFADLAHTRRPRPPPFSQSGGGLFPILLIGGAAAGGYYAYTNNLFTGTGPATGGFAAVWPQAF